jgi:hypothetical protein
MRLSTREIAPHEHHGRARRRREQDQHRDRQVDLSDLERAHGMEGAGGEMAEENARPDARGDPESQIPFKP